MIWNDRFLLKGRARGGVSAYPPKKRTGEPVRHPLEPICRPRLKEHLVSFDTAIAHSPCRSQPSLAACPSERQAEEAYQSARMMVQNEISDITSTITRDDAILNDLAHQSDESE